MNIRSRFPTMIVAVGIGSYPFERPGGPAGRQERQEERQGRVCLRVPEGQILLLHD